MTTGPPPAPLDPDPDEVALDLLAGATPRLAGLVRGYEVEQWNLGRRRDESLAALLAEVRALAALVVAARRAAAALLDAPVAAGSTDVAVGWAAATVDADYLGPVRARLWRALDALPGPLPEEDDAAVGPDPHDSRPDEEES